MMQAMMLKVAALSLLLLLGQNTSLPTDLRAQAEVVANQALAAAELALSEPTSTLPAAPSTASAPTEQINKPSETIMTEAASVSQAHIAIISPISGKGLGRSYKASPQPVDESNYLEIAAIVYDDTDTPNDKATVTVSATDGSQDKTLVGTGDVTSVYVDGAKRVVPIYSFHYEFHTSGEHTISFAANGMTESVSIEVK